MKKLLLIIGLSTLLAGCSDNEVGDVGLGWFTLKDKPTFTNTITQQF
ncbi:lipoprotein [Vibrio aestuarianus]